MAMSCRTYWFKPVLSGAETLLYSSSFQCNPWVQQPTTFFEMKCASLCYISFVVYDILLLGSALSSASSWNFLAKLARAAEKMPKVSQDARKIIQKSEKIQPRPLKIDAKTVLNDVQRQDRIKKNRSWGAPPPFFWSPPCQLFRPIFSKFEPSWPPRWAHVGGQDRPKIDKKSMRKRMNFWRPLGKP